uniref:Reverse transcriptase domain-containing protein n=1 Tax=Tanacetum cinerariifolium TaxID=118510 RepID=A0A6L2P5A2_TANCI|nr:reverse transcriptase domain-containing protein [Tanacetum cinerariifolium]
MTRGEGDGISVASELQVLLGSECGTTFDEVILVKGHELPTTVKVLPVGFDPYLLVEHFNPVGDNTGLLKSDVLDESTCLMLLEDVRGSANLTFLTLFLDVAATFFALSLIALGHRSRADPTLLNDFEMAAEGNSDLPVPDLRTMEELCQPSLNGRGGHIAPTAIQAMNFGLKNDMNSINTFDQMAKMFLGKYFSPSMVTKLINEIPNFHQPPDESLFEAWERYKLLIDRCLNHNMLPVTQIYTFYNGLTLRHRDTINAAAGGTFIKRRPEECYDLIENMTAHHNDWDTSAQQSESSSSITSFFDTEIAALKAEMAEINKNLMRVLQVNHQVKVVTPNCETCGGLHSFNDCPATVGNTKNVYAAGAYQGNTITNPKEDLKGITTRSGTAYQGPMIHTTSSSLPSVVERETEATKDTVHPANNRSTKDVQPLVVQTESPILNSEPIVAPIIEPLVALVSVSKPNQKPLIPYPSRLHDQKLRNKANDQKEKFFEIFKDLNFNIIFADALILIPKFGPTIKTLLTNKDKLSEKKELC